MIEPVPLSARELQILRLLADGLTNQGMAARLRISPGSVNKYRDTLYQKLGVHTAAHAVAVGFRHGVLIAKTEDAHVEEAYALAAALRKAGYQITPLGRGGSR